MNVNVSIIYITKRPGTYDILFSTLLNQTDQNYELICIDELADKRGNIIQGIAKEKGIPLRSIRTSKKKTYVDTKFGYANALNTGLLEATGNIVLFLQDFIWIPSRLIEMLRRFYSQEPNLKFMIGFREKFFESPEDQILSLEIVPETYFSIFKTPMISSPEILNLPVFKKNYTLKVEEFIRQKKTDQYDHIEFIEADFFECFCCAVPFPLMKFLNGFDEELDYGDDFHEKDLKHRAIKMGCRALLYVKEPCQLIEHKKYGNNPLWERFAKDSNMNRFEELQKKYEKDLYCHGNNFKL